ncbi:uncharacterized protein LOC109707652 isoform X2 [Ananas comosus]|uniref:Uncharacterized protein LOC109707652 isoform X2 n=1 Tax=Ananas comosus TaxID=4615 RepID=A0A6P5EMI6_ANACO|nr:uncharacterized protein LOC109707652 isoform X2 [Ananas comosus]
MRLARLIGTLSPRHPPPRPLPFSTTSSSSSSVASDAPARVLGVGGVLRGEPRRFSGADVAAYAAVSGDRNPLHLDAEFARGVAGFERGSVVHGMLVASLFPSLIASHFPGAIYVAQTLSFRQPVYVGDEVVAEVQAIYLKESKKRYIAKFTTKCFTNQECLVIDGEATTLLPTLVLNK